MATNFPTSLDSLTNPAAGDSLSSPSHSAQHANVNDAVEALQAKVGVDGSAVTSSLDYKVANQGLTLVKAQTIGSGVSSVTVTDAFSSTFDNYRIVFDIDSGSTSSGLQFLLGSATTGYYWFELQITTGGTIGGTGGSNDSSAKIGTVRSYGGGGGMEVLQPNKALRTSFACIGTDKSGDPFRDSRGYKADTTAYTSFTIQPNVGTMTGGKIRVYGYNDG